MRTATPYRTLVSYKETWANGSLNAGPADYANIDPSNEWTGTWRDLRFVGQTPVATGQEPENSLTGQLFGPDGTGEFGGALDVPAPFAGLRLWRDTAVATSGQLDIAPGILGYEWNTSPEDAYRPAGLIKLSDTTIPWSGILIDQGNRVAPGTATHNLSLYRDPESGALVFGAGTVFWTWVLSNQHDSSPYGANIENTGLQQFTVNMFADMGIQPGVADAILASQGLVRAVGITDTVAAATATSPTSPTQSARPVHRPDHRHRQPTPMALAWRRLTTARSPSSRSPWTAALPGRSPIPRTTGPTGATTGGRRRRAPTRSRRAQSTTASMSPTSPRRRYRHGHCADPARPLQPVRSASALSPAHPSTMASRSNSA